MQVERLCRRPAGLRLVAAHLAGAAALIRVNHDRSFLASGSCPVGRRPAHESRRPCSESHSGGLIGRQQPLLANYGSPCAEQGYTISTSNSSRAPQDQLAEHRADNLAPPGLLGVSWQEESWQNPVTVSGFRPCPCQFSRKSAKRRLFYGYRRPVPAASSHSHRHLQQRPALRSGPRPLRPASRSKTTWPPATP